MADKAEENKHGNADPKLENASDSKIVVWVENWLGRTALAAYRAPWLTLLILALVTGVGYAGAKRLRVDADLAELLPHSFQSVKDLEVLKERFGGVGYVVLVAQDAEPEALRRFADDIAPKLGALDTVRYVDYQRPVQFFSDRALYYLDLKDLVDIKERLDKRVAYEHEHPNPLVFSLEDEEPPPLDFKDLEAKYKGRGDQKWMRGQLGETYYIDTARRMLVLLVKPATISTDLTFSRKVVSDVEQVLSQVDLKAYGPTMHVDLTGRYKKRVDQQKLVQSDLRLASVVAFLLVIIYYVFHFKRALAVVLVMAPLTIALFWSYGIAGFAFSSLNILTAFIGAILVGLGDHGIHLLGRYEHEWNLHQDKSRALYLTFAQTGRAVALAGLTMTVGFAGLAFSEFRAFREFGIIAAIGMLLVVFSYATCLPAMLGIANRFGWRPYDVDEGLDSPFAKKLPQWAPTLVKISAVVTLLCAFGMTKTRFNYDFNALEDSSLLSFRLDTDVNHILGYSQTPVVILTDSVEEERAVAHALRSKQAALGTATTIDFVATGADLIPIEQEQKAPVLKDINASLRSVNTKLWPRARRKQIQKLLTMTDTAPFGLDDLPVEVRRQFRGVDDNAKGGFVLVFPAISLSDGQRVRDFAQEVRDVRLPDGSVASASGEAMIMADIINMVAKEGPPVLIITIIAIFVCMWVMLGNLRDTLLALIPSALTLVMTLGIMPAAGLSLNYLNIIMIPILFGLSVDGSAHIMTRIEDGQRLDEVLRETGRAIVGAVVTTVFGFGALMLADHRGLKSFGSFAALGLLINLLVGIVVLPAFLSWRSGRKSV